MSWEAFSPLCDPMDGPLLVVGVFGTIGILLVVSFLAWWLWPA